MINENIILIGLNGSGKSFWADKLNSITRTPVYHVDDEIEKSEQKTISAIFKEHGESYFRDKETAILKSFTGKKPFILSVGGGTPCFNNNMHWMNENGITIWLDESLKIIEQRLIKEKSHRPLIADVPDDTLFSFLSGMRKKRSEFYKLAKHHLKENEINEASFLKIFSLYE